MLNSGGMVTALLLLPCWSSKDCYKTVSQGQKCLTSEMDLCRRMMPKFEAMALSRGDDGCCLDVVASTLKEKL